MDDDDESVRAVGLVPVEGRGSMPFALLHGEALVTVASWALGEAGVLLLDFDEPWSEVQARGAALVVHDPLCPATPVGFLLEAVRAADGGDAVVVGARPVTDTVRSVDDEGVLGETVDRAGLHAVASPVVLPASVVDQLAELPSTDDLADFVTLLGERFDLVFLDAPSEARRVSDESDLELLAALSR